MQVQAKHAGTEAKLLSGAESRRRLDAGCARSPVAPERRWRRTSHHRGDAPTLDHRRGPRCAASGVRCTSRGTIRAISAFAPGSWVSTWEQDMRSLLASGCVTVMLLSAAPSYAQLDVGSGLVCAGVGAAMGGIAGAGSGAATVAIDGHSVGAVTGAFSPRASYAHTYRGYVAHGGCHWIPGHHNRWGEWRPGHCARY